MRRGPVPSAVRLAAALAGLASAAAAQERAGEAEIGYQQFVLSSGSRRIANAFGVTLGFREFIPNVGIVSVSLAPAASNGRFRTGDTFAELKRFPWLGNYWTFRAGDFRVAGRLLDVPFSNLYYPEITGRGAWVEATHGSRTLGFLYGAETLQAGVRVPVRVQTPQTMAGSYFRQNIGERLVFGVRFLSLSNDLEKLRKSPFLAVSGTPQRSSRSGTVSALYTIAGPLKFYGEATLSEAVHEQPSPARGNGPVSATIGPLVETAPVSFRANYVYQTDSYLPILGYNLGDRQGPFAEIRVRPTARLELFGSASDYTNNVARDPNRATFRATGESAGGSLQLPARFSLNAQWSVLKLATRKSGGDPWDKSASEQLQFTLARPIHRHSLRLSVRDFHQQSQIGPQRQRTAEIADNFQYRWFSLGGEVRAQRLIAQESKMSLYVRGNGQMTLKRFSAYANIETGNDLANRTLFATNTMSTTVLGASVRFTRDWDFSVEAFRNRLIMELNQQNLFALQGRGVYVPVVLSELNQWSLHFRMTKRLQWGKPIPPASGNHLDVYANGHNQLKGSVEGFVTADTQDGRRWVAGIPVALDNGLTVLTDSRGRFLFDEVGEGAHTVNLELAVLPAEFDPGAIHEATVLVKPGKPSRTDFTVVSVGYTIQGVVRGPDGVPIESIVLKLSPSGRSTTPDKHGSFAFYNLKEGAYQIALALETLPPHAHMTTSAIVPVTLRGAKASPEVLFDFEVRVPPKPVKTVILPSRAAVIPSLTEAPVPPKSGPKSQPSLPPVAEAKPSTPGNRSKSTPSALQLYTQGRELLNSGRLQEAVSMLTAAIKANPRDSLAYNARGYAHLRLTHNNEAVADFNEAIRLNPAYINAYVNRAAAKRALGDLAGAKSDLYKALKAR